MFASYDINMSRSGGPPGQGPGQGLGGAQVKVQGPQGQGLGGPRSRSRPPQVMVQGVPQVKVQVKVWGPPGQGLGKAPKSRSGEGPFSLAEVGHRR